MIFSLISPNIIKEGYALSNTAFSPKYTLSPQSEFAPMVKKSLMDTMYLESSLKYILNKSRIEDLNYKISPPFLSGIKLTFDFSLKEKKKRGVWLLPCSIETQEGMHYREYTAVVESDKGKVSIVFEKNEEALPFAESLPATDPFADIAEGSVVERPLDKIDPREVKNILIFESRKFGEAKLGETVIHVWPLVSGLKNKYPEAVIHIVSDFPDAFKGKTFNGKVKSVEPEEKEFLYQDQERRLDFLKRNDIDMVFEIGTPGVNFCTLEPDDFKKGEAPYFFEVANIMGVTSAITPVVNIGLSPQGFRDRKGRRFMLPDDEEELLSGIAEKRQISSFWGGMGLRWMLEEAGIWKLAMRSCNLFGLEVTSENLLSIKPIPEETMGALRWLEEQYQRDNRGKLFDPTRKIIMVNVYAVTQRTLISEEAWVDIIAKLIEQVQGAYLVFPHGGEMDKDMFYLDRIIDKVQNKIGRAGRKNAARKGNEMILPRESIYPHIHSLLGIADAVVTLDTGLSHLANGVYDIPTIVISSGDILHWMVPRENAKSVIGNMGITRRMDGGLEDLVHERLIEEIDAFAREINIKEERPLAKLAKAAAVWSGERNKLDAALLEKNRIYCPKAEEDLREFIKKAMELLDVPLSLMPKIVFVDSTPQTEMGVPRFLVKLYKPEGGEKYLLVDKSTLYDPLKARLASDEDLYSRSKVSPKYKSNEVIHEIMGHLLLRVMFPEFMENHQKALSMNVLGEEELLPKHSMQYIYDEIMQVKTEEEVLARLTTIRAIAELNKRSPGFIESDIIESLIDRGVDPYAENIFDNIDIVMRLAMKGRALSTLRYKEIIARKGEEIKQKLIRTYESAMMRKGLFTGSKGGIEQKDKDKGKGKESRFFSDIKDAEKLAQDMARAALSIEAAKKIVLVFDSDIGGAYKHKIASVIEELAEAVSRVQKDPEGADFRIVWADAGRMGNEVEKYSTREDTEVFMFANEANRALLVKVEKKAHSVYINDKGFEINAYYPLAQIVAIALAQYLDPGVIDQVRPFMNDLNIAEIELSKEDDTLVFTLIPDAEAIDSQKILKELAAMKRFLKAA